jgi:hypothetical protein
MKLYETHMGWIKSSDISREKYNINKHNKSRGFIVITLRVVR